MLANLKLFDNTEYKIADKTTEANGILYEGRIVEDIALTTKMAENGNAPLTINLTIRNDDNFIGNNKDLWGATLELTADNGDKWLGKVTFYNFDADGNVYITATEKAAPELELQMPDEVRQVYSITNDFHQSSQTMTIPMVVGGTHANPIPMSTILIDKINGVYLICVGEIREIVAVYNGSEALNSSDYEAYTGTAAQTEHKGFAYVKIKNDKHINADGSYAEINVDVVGLKLGSYNEEQCRNGARFLYYFLTTPSSGVNGWGCGIDSSEIDQISFNSAITLCETLGYKLDGVLWLRQSASAWINQICQAIHGSYSINANGKRRLFIDYGGAASKKTFDANNMKVSRRGKNAYSGAVYNKGILSYGYNPITGLFMQSAQYENAESIEQIGEQKFVGESYLINDAATALAVLEYTCKRSQSSAEAIEFETDDLDVNLYAGDIITIDRSDIGVNGLFQIANISTNKTISTINAVRFDTSVFVVDGSKTNVNWGSEKAIIPALTPAEATNLLLTTGFDINPDGTGTPYIKGTFTLPSGGWLAAAVQYGIGTNPTNWTELALISNDNFIIQPVSVGTVYTVRIRMITATGHSDYISGQITSTGDSIAPAIPTIAVNATDKSVIVQCAIDNPPYDMGGFQIHRKKHSESVYTLIGNVAANRGYASFSDYVDEWVAYDYKAKSYDRSGNLSDFSEAKTVTVTGIQANDIAATALRIPTGSILRLSAKGCTTASIKQTTDSSGNPVYGVKDVSGYNHHGRAYGGVTVLDGGEGFGFDGVNNSYIHMGNLPQNEEYSLFFIIKSTKNTVFIVDSRNDSSGIIVYRSDDKIRFDICDANNSGTQTLISFDGCGNRVFDGSLHTIAFTADTTTKTLYIDGGKFGEISSTAVLDTTKTPAFRLGARYSNGQNAFAGELKEFRIYPRALSATEVKSMYMLPDEAIFGQLNADLIGANVIRASNLVMTEALITNAAQIDQAVVNNLNVSGNATFQAGLASKSNYVYITSPYSATLSTINDYSTRSSLLFTVGTEAAKVNVGDTVALKYAVTDVSSISYVYITGKCLTKTSTTVTLECQGYINPNSMSQTINAANTAQSNAISTASSDATAKVKVVTDNIYTANTTTINGGKITTGSITAGAIAANAVTAEKINAGAITAEKITVAAGSLPTTPSIVLKAQAGYFASGSYVGDTSGLGNRYKLSAAFTSYSNANLGYMWRRTSMAASAIVLDANQTVSIGASFTFSIIYNISDWSAQPVFFDAKAADNANRVTIYATTGRVVKVAVYNASGTATTITLGTCSNGAWRRLTVVCNAGTWTSYDSAYTASTATETVSATTAAHAALTATAIAFGNLAASASASRGFIGYLGHIFVYNYALSKDQHFSLVKHGMTRELGTITADRIATDAIKSRTLSGGGDGSYTTNGSMFNLAGNGYISMKNFLVSSGGIMKCKGAEIEGKVTATSGKIAGLTIYGGGLKGVSDNIATNYINLYCSLSNTEKENYDALFQSHVLSLHYERTTNPSTVFFNKTRVKPDNIDVSYGANGSVYAHTTIASTSIRINQGGYTDSVALDVTGRVQVNGSVVHGSDRNIKSGIKQTSTLNKLKQLNVYSWKYDEDKLALREYNKKIAKGEEAKKPKLGTGAKNNAMQIGPMAQDFNALFGTNNGSEDYISYTDTIGVCMRAIQELSEQLDNAVREIRRLKRILRANGTITDEIIAEDRDNEAIRRLEIAQARQAKREVVTDENTDSDSDTDNTDGLR